MKAIPVPAEALDEWLPQIGWHLAKFCEDGHAIPEDFIADLRDRQRQLWIAADDEVALVLLTQVLGDRHRTVQVTHAAGRDMGRWLGMWSVIEGWAREIGSRRVEIVGRFGWERVMRRHGLTPARLILGKDI